MRRSTVTHAVHICCILIWQMLVTRPNVCFAEDSVLILILENRARSCTHECKINFMIKNKYKWYGFRDSTNRFSVCWYTVYMLLSFVTEKLLFCFNISIIHESWYRNTITSRTTTATTLYLYLSVDWIFTEDCLKFRQVLFKRSNYL